MNKTVNIHLAQTLFSLDEKAYAILKEYLDQLERLFQKTEGGKDILEDIEIRIAELFSEIKKDPLYVISVEEVNQVIETLGAPEDLAQEEENENEHTQHLGAKKLFRDPDDRFIGGVAGGLSHYIGLDSVWIRLILILLVLSSVGGVIFVYILLWVLVPEAKTTADKLKMKGQPVNVSNIKNKIKEELNQVSEKVKEVDYNSLGDQLKKKSKGLSDLVLKLIEGAGRIIALLLGVFLVFISVIAMLGVFFSAIIGSVFSATLPNELIQLGTFIDIPYFIIGLFIFILVGLPFVGLFTIGLRLLSSRGPIMGRSTKITLFAIWLASVFLLMLLGALETKSFAVAAHHTQTEAWAFKKGDTLKVYKNSDPSYSEAVFLFDSFTLVEDEMGNKMQLNDDVRIEFESHTMDSIRLKRKMKAKGWNQNKALENAKSMEYDYDYYNKQMVVNDYWLSPVKSKNRPDNVRLTLTIPEESYIQLDEDLAELISSKVKNDQDYYRRKIAGHLWKMKNGELICQDCSSNKSSKLFIDDNHFELNINDDENSIRVNINEKGLDTEHED